MKNYLSALILALGILGFGFLLKSGIENFKQMDRVVTVKGLSEKEVASDLVIWPIV